MEFALGTGGSDIMLLKFMLRSWHGGKPRRDAGRKMGEVIREGYAFDKVAENW